MNTPEHNFERSFFFEVALTVLFIIGLIFFYLGVIPDQFESFILGFIGAIGIIPVAGSAWESIKERRVNVDLLATIALAFSFLGREWGSVLFINLMLTSARLFDLYTKRRARISLESLAKLKPSEARVVRENEEVMLPLSEVNVGDIVKVDLGEQIPVDGTVERGEATVDQSSLTGESIPVLKVVNDRVHSATMVVSGNIFVRTERVGAETTFEKMIQLVESAQGSKTHVVTLGERFADWYIGIMLVVSIALYFYTKNLSLVLSVVLVVCADDIAVATPIAFITSIGTAAKRGIIVKSADFLEAISKVTTLVVDKTGTITMGKLAVKNVLLWGDTPKQDVLKLTGSVCRGSTHPVSKAIVEYIKNQGITLDEPESFEEKEGRGMQGIVAGKKVIVGRVQFLTEAGVPQEQAVTDSVKSEHDNANNVTLVAVDGKIVALFALADEMRSGINSTIVALKKRGLEETMMLTGDNEAIARVITKSAGIDGYSADLLPENKVSALEKYIKKGKVVAMVGDGVNDAAVLARADVGIAMGGIGSDAAIESADVVLMKDDFSKILELHDIAQRVMSVARQNFIIWGTVNVIGLYLVFTNVIGPSGAAAYNFLTDFLPIANSLRLFYYRKS